MPEGFYRLLITRCTSRLHAQGIYDRDCDYIWYDESNPLSGYRGFAAKEFPLYVKNNAPRLVDYTDVRANNTAVRAADTPLREGSEAWTQYTDVYLKDLEWSMNTDGENVPLLAGQVDYLAGVAEELSAGAADDYARLLSFYRYICENFYYDSYAFSESRHACCNPYENLYALRSGSTGLNSLPGGRDPCPHGQRRAADQDPGDLEHNDEGLQHRGQSLVVRGLDRRPLGSRRRRSRLLQRVGSEQLGGGRRRLLEESGQHQLCRLRYERF